ncbi:hypothetical protein ACFXPV_16410 [Streptomyces sp. NPDC059118]|uniref:hypothetical protein n=1 Tax=unclassified Streptomyces TaxID=2593676 RepID=UPI0036AA04F0
MLPAGLPVEGSPGCGRLDGARALCRTGPVILVVERLAPVGGRGFGLVREPLPGHVAAGAGRIGRGPERVTLPGVCGPLPGDRR